MSNNVNTTIRERAFEASENCTNSMLGAYLDGAIERGDLELMQSLTTQVEQYNDYLDAVNDSKVEKAQDMLSEMEY